MTKMLLLIDTMYHYDREVLKGIKAKADECRLKATLHIESINNSEDILKQHWDYVIADGDKADKYGVLQKLNTHTLLYSGHTIEKLPENASTVVVDNQQMVRLVLGQFIKNNISNVAYYLDPSELEQEWAKERVACFASSANELEFKYHDDVFELLNKRVFPIGIYCATDRAARKLSNYCIDRKISIPNQVSIIGTDYDDAERTISPVPLTSIDLSPYMLGQRCLEVLLKAKSTKQRLHEKYLPQKLMNESSTQSEENQDDIVNQALYYLHNNYHRNIKVKQVTEYCRVSRRTLDNRFYFAKGMTVHQYLSDLRIAKSKELLRTSNNSIESIALQCGYPNQSYLYQVYRKLFGYTPYTYRQGQN
ncbi:helix-turn-helix domain-containing protein [Vibrio sp. SM6]|uniref:Helix-turn-helix domain-containing protein n=1 Tax=Vibrio agarilyticus TaxID=2726741 RepID=A0A7X8TQ62_9VIBR|nr:helix-turn-helix domain-containing protein [Vibrio agarilyticus]NLS12193.1 helix-turn-helix domain-containing protein [Vibrio agarilyticus]